MNTLLFVAVLASFTKSTQGKGRIGNDNRFGIEPAPEPWVDKPCNKFVGLWEGSDIAAMADTGVPFPGTDASLIKLNFRCKERKDCSTVTLQLTDNVIGVCSGGSGFVIQEYECDDRNLKATTLSNIICSDTNNDPQTTPFAWNRIEFMDDGSVMAFQDRQVEGDTVAYGPHWMISNN